MDKIISNRLLLASVGALLLYWLVGAVVPGNLISLGASFALFTFGALTFVQYAGPTYQVLFRMERSDHATGSHLAIFGIWLLASGAIWSGAFAFLWHWHGQPDFWLGTAYSAFGRALISGGFFLMYIAPDNAAGGVRINAPLWIAVAVIAGLGLGAIVGFNWSTASTSSFDPWRVLRSDMMPRGETGPPVLAASDKEEEGGRDY